MSVWYILQVFTLTKVFSVGWPIVKIVVMYVELLNNENWTLTELLQPYAET